MLNFMNFLQQIVLGVFIVCVGGGVNFIAKN